MNSRENAELYSWPPGYVHRIVEARLQDVAAKQPGVSTFGGALHWLTLLQDPAAWIACWYPMDASRRPCASTTGLAPVGAQAWRPEAMATLLELLAQLPIIINFAVEYQPCRAVFVRDWLRASIQVDNTEPAHAQRGIVVQVIPFRVRPAMLKQPTGCPEPFGVE